MLEAHIAVKAPISLDRAITEAAKSHHLDKPAYIRAALARVVEAGLFNPWPPDNSDSDVQKNPVKVKTQYFRVEKGNRDRLN